MGSTYYFLNYFHFQKNPKNSLINETETRQRKRNRQKLPRNSSKSRKCQKNVRSQFANISEKEEREILDELDRIFHPEKE